MKNYFGCILDSRTETKRLTLFKQPPIFASLFRDRTRRASSIKSTTTLDLSRKTNREHSCDGQKSAENYRWTGCGKPI